MAEEQNKKMVIKRAYYRTCSRVFTVSRGVVITEEQAPANNPAVACTGTISIWEGFSAILSV